MKKAFVLTVSVAILLTLSGCFSSLAETSVEEFMAHHSEEELVEYIARNSEMSYIAELFNEEFRGDYCFISTDDLQEIINEVYAEGYAANIESGDIERIRKWTDDFCSFWDYIE